MVVVNTGRQGIVSRFSKYFEIAGSIGEAYQRLPPKPKILDWLAFGALLGKAWGTWTDHQIKASQLSAYNFFNKPNEDWETVPIFVWPLIRDNVIDPKVVPGFWNGEEGGLLLAEGMIDNLPFRWIQEGTTADQLTHCPMVPVGRREDALTLLTERFWAVQPTPHVIFEQNSIRDDETFEHNAVMTNEIQKLVDRAQKFMNRGLTRSLLLVGLPGAGKSTAVRACVKYFGLRSLRLGAGVMGQVQRSYDGSRGVNSVMNVVQLTRPDVLIIDDVDHMMLSAYALSFFENIRPYCRLVLTTCNSTKSLLGAALRPGRFDDIIEFKTVDSTLLGRLAHGDPQIAQRLEQLPVAYAQSFHDTVLALGFDQAVAELSELESRAAAIEQATEKLTHSTTKEIVLEKQDWFEHP